MDEDLEIVLLAGLDAICEQHDINPLAVLKLMIEEGLIHESAIYSPVLEESD